MGIRFRKSIKILPGVRLNFSKSGVSATIGVRGASINVNKSGAYANLGLPGTGFSTRTKIASVSSSEDTAKFERATPSEFKAFLKYLQNAGYPYKDYHDVVEYANREYYDIVNIHESTISINKTPFNPEPIPRRKFNLNRAVKSVAFAILLSPAFAWLIFTVRGVNRSYDALLSLIMAAFTVRWCGRRRREKERAEYVELKTKADKEKELRELSVKKSVSDTELNELVSAALERLTWPRETSASYEIKGDSVYVDIELPSLDEMPKYKYKASPQGESASFDRFSDTRIRKDYLRHVHGVAAVIIGCMFSASRQIDRVVVSGYTNTHSTSTGNNEECYIFSVRVSRREWSNINFTRLSDIDPVDMIGSFDVRRSINKSGTFDGIEPFSIDE